MTDKVDHVCEITDAVARGIEEPWNRCYTANHLLRHHLPHGTRGEMAHGAFLREWIAGRRPDRVPPEIAAIIDRNARTAVVVDDFHHRLLTESKRTPFPAQALALARASNGR